jgi:hypothetical protein
MYKMTGSITSRASTTPATPAAGAQEAAEAGFPSEGTPSEKLRYLLRWGVLAPSNHNTQPWLFEVSGGTLSLYADRTRALPVADPHDRELVISCGAALFYLRVAARHFGCTTEIDYMPDPRTPDLLARVRLGEKVASSADWRLLYEAIPRRHTNRGPFEDRRIAVESLVQMGVATRHEGAWLHVLQSPEQRESVAALVAEADRIQWADRRFRRELAAWLHPAWNASDDGVPGYTLGFEALSTYNGPQLVRTFDLGNGQAARDQELAEGSPMLAVIGTDGDSRADWLVAGQALSSMLLYAAAGGASVSFLNQPIEVEEMRPKVMALLGREGFAQLLLRVGYGPDVRPTPRREVKEVLL